MNFLFLILSTSILMSFIILLALALFSFFPEQFSGKTRYFIWIIILIGLITIELPRQTESDVFVEETATSSTPANSGTTPAKVTNDESSSPSSSPEAESAFDQLKKNTTPVALILGVWLLGAFISFSRHLYHYYQFKKIVRRWSKPVEDLTTLELFDIWQKVPLYLKKSLLFW